MVFLMSIAIHHEDTATHIREVRMHDTVKDIDPFSLIPPLPHLPNPPTNTQPARSDRSASGAYEHVHKVQSLSTEDPGLFASKPATTTPSQPKTDSSVPQEVILPVVHGPALSHDPPNQLYDNWNGLLAHNWPPMDVDGDLPVDEERLEDALAHPLSDADVAALEAEGPWQSGSVGLGPRDVQAIVSA